MKKIILHACCAPCSSYPLIKLKEDGFGPAVFFYNPNIFPYEEYVLRRDELKNYCKNLDVEFFEGKYDIKEFYEISKNLEKEPEKGLRCSKCFNLRLSKTAQFTRDLGIDCFTTTLSVSPHKNSDQIFKEGNSAGEKYGVKFLEYNFKKQDGFKISRKIAKENDMYAQNYCGCEFSMKKS